MTRRRPVRRAPSSRAARALLPPNLRISSTGPACRAEVARLVDDMRNLAGEGSGSAGGTAHQIDETRKFGGRAGCLPKPKPKPKKKPEPEPEHLRTQLSRKGS